MATRQQLIKRIKDLGCTLEEENSRTSVLTPYGKVFATTGCHEAMIRNEPTGAWKQSEIYDGLLQDMSMGLEVCPEVPNCEWCDE